MEKDKLILTYFKLSEKERREHYAGGSLAAFLHKGNFAAGYAHLVILQDDGTVIASGDNQYSQCDVSEWSDVTKVAAGDYHTVALKSDGTVVATGDNKFNQCNVSDWSGVTDIYADKGMTVCVTEDGSVLMSGMKVKKQIEAEDTAPVDDTDFDTRETEAPKWNKLQKTYGNFLYRESASDGIIIDKYVGNEQSVTIPDAINGVPVKAIGRGAFATDRFSPIKSIHLPKDLERIEYKAFFECNSLKSVRIPDQVTSIEWYAFAECTKLETVVMSKNIRELGGRAFENCFGLKHVYFTNAAMARLGQSIEFAFEDMSVISYHSGAVDVQ